MDKFVQIEKLEHYLGINVQFSGIVEQIQNQGGLLFLEVSDLNHCAKALITPDKPELYKLAKQIKEGYLVSISGIVKECPLTAQHAVCEVDVDNLQILSTKTKMANIIQVVQNKKSFIN